MLAREPGRLRTAVGSSKDRIVEGIVYRHRAGIAWRNLPREHFGPWQTVWKRHRRYAADGTWARVLARVSVMPMLLVTLIEFLCSRFWLTFESHGPTVVVLTCPAAVLADRAYGPKADREYLCSRGIRAVIPEKKDQIAVREKRGSNGGGPPAFDAGAYRNRDVVGRSSACLKRWRRLAARSDKPAIVYRAAVVVSAIRRLRR